MKLNLDRLILLSNLGLLALVFHKTRRVHLATYALKDQVRKSSDTLFTQLQALLALERKLQLKEPLPAMRGWAGSPDFLLRVAEEVSSRRPMVVMECGSGVSTIVIARCLQLNGVGHVYSLEHQEEYAEKTRAMLAKHELTSYATVIDAPLTTQHTETPWYDEGAIPEGLGPIELLVVDGPPARTAPLARLPALPRLRHKMADQFLVMLDDADQPDEQAIVSKWQQQYPSAGVWRAPCEKGLAYLEQTGRSEPLADVRAQSTQIASHLY